MPHTVGAWHRTVVPIRNPRKGLAAIDETEERSSTSLALTHMNKFFYVVLLELVGAAACTACSRNCVDSCECTQPSLGNTLRQSVKCAHN